MGDDALAGEKKAPWRLGMAFSLNLAFSAIEIVAGFFLNSSAILADAVHNFSDSASVAIAWVMEKVSVKKKDRRFSYGYRRFSTLAALINEIILFTGGALVVAKAIPLITHPEKSAGLGLIVVAFLGIVFNGAGLILTRRGKSLSESVVSLHFLEDVMSEAAIVVAGITLLFFDIPILDPLLSLGIVAFVLWNGIRRFRLIAGIFLQAVPMELNVPEIERKLGSLRGVVQVHDTHSWSLDGENKVLTTHITLGKKTGHEEGQRIKCRAVELLKKEGISYTTIELEKEGETCRLEKN